MWNQKRDSSVSQASFIELSIFFYAYKFVGAGCHFPCTFFVSEICQNNNSDIFLISNLKYIITASWRYFVYSISIKEGTNCFIICHLLAQNMTWIRPWKDIFKTKVFSEKNTQIYFVPFCCILEWCTIQQFLIVYYWNGVLGSNG